MSSVTSDVTGNASEQIKIFLKDILHIFGEEKPYFASSILTRMDLKEVTFRQNSVEPQRQEALVVHNLTVDEDMVNAGGNIHGGCSAFLIDTCSTCAIIALKLSRGDIETSVSQSMTIVYHAPAAVGEVLKIVNTTMTAGRRVLTARTEIWSETHHRLVASGVHIKMAPSPAKL